jgi:glycosyltransferase involved in cell wall biosynthesis
MPLVIAGDGNYFAHVKGLVEKHGLQEKIIMLGYVPPALLKQITPMAYAGITLFDNSGLNQYYSLANRFFDYIQAGIPQLCNDYPEYAAIQAQYEVALLINDVEPETIAAGLNKLISNGVVYNQLKQQCLQASIQLCWENEDIKLLNFWKKILPL